MMNSSNRAVSPRFGFFKKLSLCSLSLLSLASTSLATPPAPGDYDGGGRSDLASASISKSAFHTSWYVRSTETGAVTSYEFNVPGDALVTGRFYGGNKTYPGLVWVRDAKKPLEWYIKNPTGTENFFLFGSPGDTIPNMGDMDCDGVTDIITVRDGSGSSAGYKVWNVALSTQPGVVAQSLFGTSSDKVFVADMDGDGCAELGAFRPNGFLWFAKKLFGNDVSQFQWGLPGDRIIPPMDMNLDGKADHIIVRESATGQVAYIHFTGSDKYATELLGGNSSVPMTGNFVGVPYFAWAQRDTGFTAIKAGGSAAPNVFLFGSAAHWIVRPDGTVITANDSGKIGNVLPPPGSGGGSNTFNGILRCDIEIARQDGRGGYKSNAHNSRKTLKQIFPSKFNFKIQSVYAFKDGQVFDKFHSMGFEIGFREWWNGSMNISKYPDDLVIAVNFYDGTQACVTLPDPQTTYD